MNKRILFLSHYFPPEVNAPANRTYEHCRIWANEMDVTVITNFPNHPDGRIFPGYKNRLIQKEIIDGINVIRVWTFITPNEGFILRSLNYLVYMMVSILYVLLSGIKFDIVIATSPQFFCGLAGKYISKIKNKPFILELRDLWPESIVAVGALKNKAIIKYLTYVEYRLYKSAQKIVSVTDSFKNILVSRGIDPEKIKVIYNGIDPILFTNRNEIKNEELKIFLNDGFIVGYIGTIGMAHSIITLINAAEICEDTDIKFVIIGSGAERLKLERTITEKKLENIKIFPLQPKGEIPTIINKLSIFCIHLKNDPLFKTVIPSKMFEGMIMQKPILIGVDGEARRIIEEAECGLYFQSENSQDMLEKIKYLKEHTKNSELMGINGYNKVLTNFDRNFLASEFKDLIFKMIK